MVLLSMGMIISCSSCRQQAVKPKPGEPLRLLWSFKFTRSVVGISTVNIRPALLGNGAVITALDRQYSSLSQQDGSVNWQHLLPMNSPEINNRLTYDEEYLYGKTDQDSIYFAINLKNGKIVWKKINSYGAFFDYTHDGVNNNYLYLAGDDPVIYVYDKSTGSYVKRIQLESYARAITPIKNALFVSEAWKPDSAKSAHGRIIKINAKTNQTLWQYTTQNGGYYEADLIVRNELVYSGTTSGPGEVVALDAQTGKVKWEQTGFECYQFIVANGTLYIDTGSGMSALNAKTGSKLWYYDYGNSGGHSVAYINGYVYNAHEGGLYIFNAQTGKLAAGPIYAPDGSPFNELNAANGRLFIQSDYHLYCYKAYSGGE
jgi:outer membrane protein assembly factor BamB